MRKLILGAIALAAVSAAATTTSDISKAGVIAPMGAREAAQVPLHTETIQFTRGGRRFCWYNAGWRGAGWYWCGFNRRRGMGWGGPSGWNGWRPPGNRPVSRPPQPRPPGFQRPQPLPAPVPR
jgi:hypothetical protein